MIGSIGSIAFRISMLGAWVFLIFGITAMFAWLFGI